MIAYLVKLGWRSEFLFDDLKEAASFARAAFLNRTGEEADDEISIVIRKQEIKGEGVEDETDNVRCGSGSEDA